MVKDVSETEKEEKKKEKEEQRKPSFFDKVPIRWKVAGFLIIAVIFLQIQSKGGKLQEIWPWAAAVLIVWWLIGQAGVKLDTGTLTPKEARDALREEIETMKRDGDLPTMATVHIGPVSGLKYTDGMPMHYEIFVQMYDDTMKVFRRAIVNAKGAEKGYVTIQDHVGKVTGREVIPTKFPIPRSWREARDKLGIDLDEVIFGKQKK